MSVSVFSFIMTLMHQPLCPQKRHSDLWTNKTLITLKTVIYSCWIFSLVHSLIEVLLFPSKYLYFLLISSRFSTLCLDVHIALQGKHINLQQFSFNWLNVVLFLIFCLFSWALLRFRWLSLWVWTWEHICGWKPPLQAKFASTCPILTHSAAGSCLILSSLSLLPVVSGPLFTACRDFDLLLIQLSTAAIVLQLLIAVKCLLGKWWMWMIAYGDATLVGDGLQHY